MSTAFLTVPCSQDLNIATLGSLVYYQASCQINAERCNVVFFVNLAAFCPLQALQSIADLRCLQQLVLADCSAVTTGGLEQLSGLVGLHHLALLRCPRVGDQGMTVLRCLTRLTYLALTGCSKVPSQLTVLLAHPDTLWISVTLTFS